MFQCKTINAIILTHRWSHFVVEFQHVGPCQTESVHGWIPMRAAAHAGWYAWKRSPADSTTLFDLHLDDQQKRSTWKAKHVRYQSKSRNGFDFRCTFSCVYSEAHITPTLTGCSQSLPGRSREWSGCRFHLQMIVMPGQLCFSVWMLDDEIMSIRWKNNCYQRRLCCTCYNSISFHLLN